MPGKSKSRTTTRNPRKPRKPKDQMLPLITPGEILREEFMKPLRLSVNALSLQLRVPSTRMLEIVNGRRSISVDTALRLGRYFGNSAQFWLNLEQNYQLQRGEREMAATITRDVNPRMDMGAA